MPRTTTLECPGCPPIRALATDELGLIKVVESRESVGIPKVVERWGSPDASRHVLLASMADSKTTPLLAVARKNNEVQLINPLNGDILTTDKVSDAFSAGQVDQDDLLATLHLLRTGISEFRDSTLLMCTEKGKACIRSIKVGDGSTNSTCTSSLNTWDICNAGKVLCSSIDGLEKFAFFAGKGIEVNVWDLDQCNKIWTAKSPPRNSLDIFTPTWFTSTTLLCKDDHRKIVAGTNDHQVRLYDISAQRRPVISVDFRDTPIKALVEDLDGHTIYVGTGKGDLASFDMRTGKLLGCFIGKCCGSIRSLARHPEHPVVVSCGLDRYLRFWDAKTRQPLAAVFLKQILTNIVLDNNFSAEVACSNADDRIAVTASTDQGETKDEDGTETRKMKKLKKDRMERRMNTVDSDMLSGIQDDDHGNNLLVEKRRNSFDEKDPARRHKHQKKKKQTHDDDSD